jgi:threonine dehydrogenase-like Zn-dependent dehydrogenase
VDLSPVIANEVQIVGSRDGPIPDALRMLAEDSIDVLSLVTRHYKFEDAMAAMQAAAGGESLAVVVDM